ncbi:MAG: hypothetical protein QOI68_3807, partial [Pseudonocardiales bacterium]|nr:hypothetical protein [Pseudonocardiales bacterium]
MGELPGVDPSDGFPELTKIFPDGGWIFIILGMSESSIVAARRVVMDSMAALRALERTGGAECR